MAKGWDPAEHPRGAWRRFTEIAGSAPEARLGPVGAAPAWPAIGSLVVPWSPSGRRGSAEDRRMREVEASMPARIQDAEYRPRSTREMDRAVREVKEMEAASAGVLGPLASFLVRTESAASSKIEHVSASVDDFARALGGVRANPSATSMAAAATAITTLIEASSERIRLDRILGAHRALMADDETEAGYAGRIRDVQNWIGGSDFSPRGAMYVPPPADTVPGYLDDLIAFAGRDDIHPVAQAAIAHAQFESIHPFTDGNGRIGRALIGAVLRRRGVAEATVIPVASALSADTGRYFDLLTAYRCGDADGIVDHLAVCVQVSARQSAATGARLRGLPGQWREMTRIRRGSAAETLLAALPGTPVFTVEGMAAHTGLPELPMFRAVDKLGRAGIIREVTRRKRGRVFAAGAVLDELSDLDLRIRQAMGAETR